MSRQSEPAPTATTREIASVFLKLGATSYGGPAMMGVMQAELGDRRQWVSRERFVEGVSLVNMLPGATATQLGIFLATREADGGADCSAASASCCRRSS